MPWATVADGGPGALQSGGRTDGKEPEKVARREGDRHWEGQPGGLPGWGVGGQHVQRGPGHLRGFKETEQSSLRGRGRLRKGQEERDKVAGAVPRKRGRMVRPPRPPQCIGHLSQWGWEWEWAGQGAQGAAG